MLISELLISCTEWQDKLLPCKCNGAGEVLKWSAGGRWMLVSAVLLISELGGFWLSAGVLVAGFCWCWSAGLLVAGGLVCSRASAMDQWCWCWSAAVLNY
jgi:hypothetical protein